MSILKRIGRNYFWGFLGETLGRGLMFFLIILLSRRLGPESFGFFSFVQSVFMFLWIIIDLGLGLYGTREIAQNNKNLGLISSVNEILITRTLLATFVSIFCIIFALTYYHNMLQKWLVIGFSAYLIIRANQMDWFLKGKEDYKSLFVISTSSYLILFASGSFLIKSEEDLYLASLPWVLMSIAMVTIGYIYSYNNYNFKFTYKTISSKKIIEKWKVSIYFTLSNGVSALYEAAPIFFLFLFSTPDIVGLYTAPYRLIVASFFVISIYPMVIFPVLSNLYKKDVLTFIKTVTWSAISIFILTIIISFVAWTFAEKIIIYLFTEDYRQSIVVFKILLLFFILRSTRAVFVRAICAANGEKEYSQIAIQALIVLLTSMTLVYISDLFTMYSASIILTVTELFIVIRLLIKVMKKMQKKH